MHITIRVHDSQEVIAQFRAWRRSLPGTRDDQIRWGKYYLECMGKAITGGIAPEPVLTGADGDLIEWEFLKGVKFSLVRRILSRHEIEMVVMGVKVDRPARSEQ